MDIMDSKRRQVRLSFQTHIHRDKDTKNEQSDQHTQSISEI